ncbi:hypothetical protein PMAYCL1PPCAC_23248, partial [Pristionchus mayeri]
RSASSSSIGGRGGAFVAVASFRGGVGHYSKPQETQTITSPIIYSALFQNESALFSSRSDKILWIAHPESPVTIKDDLVYFWDKKYLPDPESNLCSHFVSSNSHKSTVLCNLTGMERCTRRMSEASELRSISFFASPSTQ